MAIPSIAMIPSGYKANKLYSVLPTNGDGDFTTTRNTVATRVNSNGLIEEVAVNAPRLDYSDGACPSLLLEPTSTNLIQYSEAFGNAYWNKSGSSIQGDPSTAGTEEVTNGDFATDSDWTKGSDWTISGGKANLSLSDSAANSTLTSTGLVLDASKIYLISYDISNYVSGGLALVVGNISIPSSNGFHQFQYTGQTDFSIKRFGGATQLSIDNVSVKEVQGFASPSGDTSAFKLVEDNNISPHRVNFSSTISLGVVAKHTYSLFAKKGENNFIGILDLASVKGRWFNLNDGTIGEARVNAPISSKIEELSNGWYKCSITVEATNSNGNLYIYTSSDGIDSNVSYQGDGTSGIYIFGTQLEQQSYATSYIKNEGTAAGITRAADSATGSGDATVINSTEGVLYAEISAFDNTSRISLSDGSTSNRVGFRITDDNIDFQYRVGGSYSYRVDVDVDNSNTIKIAMSFNNGVFVGYLNGVAIGNPISGASLGQGILDRLNLNDGGSSDSFNGNVKDVRVYTTALSDLEIETLSSWTSFTAMANALNYTII